MIEEPAVLAGITAGRVWVFVLLQLGAYETFALITGRTTLSRCAWDAFDQVPMLEALAGALVAHFLWRWRRGL